MKKKMTQEDAKELLQQKVERIEAHDRKQLAVWIRSRLNGEDVILADVAGNSRAYPLLAIYPRLSRIVREDIQQVCLNLLGDFVSGSHWNTDAAEDLLILCQGLTPQQAADRLSLLAETPHLFEQLPIKLQSRVLDTIVALGGTLDDAIWQAIFARAPDEFARSCFEGMASNSSASAVKFLTQLKTNKSTIMQLKASLPGVLARFRNSGEEETLIDAVSTNWRRIRRDLRDELVDWCSAMKIPLKQHSRDTWIGARFEPRFLSLGFSNKEPARRRDSLSTAAL